MVKQRHQAVLAAISDGLSISQVATTLGVSRQTVHSWSARYETQGLEGLIGASAYVVSSSDARAAGGRAAGARAFAPVLGAAAAGVRTGQAGREAGALGVGCLSGIGARTDGRPASTGIDASSVGALTDGTSAQRVATSPMGGVDVIVRQSLHVRLRPPIIGDGGPHGADPPLRDTSTAKCCLERSTLPREEALCHCRFGGDDVESVEGSFDDVELTAHTSLAQPVRIFHVLAVERIHRSHPDPRGSKVGQVVASRRYSRLAIGTFQVGLPSQPIALFAPQPVVRTLKARAT